MQTTLKAQDVFEGVGLHLGKPVRMVVRPAGAEHGIWFRRMDVTDCDPMVPAIWDAVIPVPLCTRVQNAAGVTVSTIEHLMAALVGCGIHNALVEIDGPEVPILDGSAAPFVSRLAAAGLRRLNAPIQGVEVLRPVEVRNGDASARLEPAKTLEIDFSIDFVDAAIGYQHKSLNLANGAFVRELANSRTFCRQADVDDMRANGLALGGTLLNAVVVDGARVLSPGGVRHGDEAVRHKMLDALGDLGLAGAPILGRYVGHRSGHAMTNQLLRALFEDPANYRVVECTPEDVARLPGAGLRASDLAQAVA